MKKTLIISVGIGLTGLFSQLTWSAQALDFYLTDQRDRPLVEAVITLTPLNEVDSVGTAPNQAVIDQIKKEFVPAVSVVQTGTLISFPNNDDILHHVYSFSEANTFDLPLYKGTPTEPVLFAKPGLVTLGCNIHDWMKAYVVVVDTPHHKISGEKGQARLENVPNGQYKLEVWHARQRRPYSRTLSVDKSMTKNIKVMLKPQLRSRRHSSGRSKQY